MWPRSSAHLPGTGGKLVSSEAEEVLTKQPAETGDHLWIRVQKEAGLGSQQVRQALARSVAVSPDLVSDAGNRDRGSRFIQWFSMPLDLIDNPGPIRRAGAHGKLRVLEVTRSHKPFTVEHVERIRWKVRLAGANREGGYQKAKAVIDHLRVYGVPNYVPASRFGTDGQLVRWGKILLRGDRLPPQVTRGGELSPGTCLRAVQEWLFNRWLATRVDDGLLGSTVVGDLIRGRTGAIEEVVDTLHADKRVGTWEASVLGPLFGKGMPPSSGEAADREAATLIAAEMGAVDQLHGDRRAARAQPQKTILDLAAEDLLVTCELPVDADFHGVVDELVK